MDRVEKTNAMRLLDRSGIAYETLSYPSDGEAVDALEVARLLGEPPGRIYKTLILQGSDAQHCVCVIPGPSELDLKSAAAGFRIKSLSMLPVANLKPVTGYVRGGCSPFGMKKPLRTAVDVSAAALPYVIVSGGRIGLQIRLKPDDLIKAAGAFYAPLARQAAEPRHG